LDSACAASQLKFKPLGSPNRDRLAMKLPNPNEAVVEAAKVRDYLLSSEHPVGRFKATVFMAARYQRGDWDLLRHDRLATARRDARALESTPYGQKYAVAATLQGPAGRALTVQVIWFVRAGQTFARFITAYPRAR
jgi:hypothetical protein